MAEISKENTKGLEISKEQNIQIGKKIKSSSDFEKQVKASTTESMSKLSVILLGGAINLNASDIHIEPGKIQAKIRARVDGLLQDITTIPREVYENLLSRIKLLSGIKLNITNRPQDGRFSVLIDGLSVEIRTSTLPAEHGESIVLRILNPKSLI